MEVEQFVLISIKTDSPIGFIIALLESNDDSGKIADEPEKASTVFL